MLLYKKRLSFKLFKRKGRLKRRRVQLYLHTKLSRTVSHLFFSLRENEREAGSGESSLPSDKKSCMDMKKKLTRTGVEVVFNLRSSISSTTRSKRVDCEERREGMKWIRCLLFSLSLSLSLWVSPPFYPFLAEKNQKKETSSFSTRRGRRRTQFPTSKNRDVCSSEQDSEQGQLSKRQVHSSLSPFNLLCHVFEKREKSELDLRPFRSSTWRKNHPFWSKKSPSSSPSLYSHS